MTNPSTVYAALLALVLIAGGAASSSTTDKHPEHVPYQHGHDSHSSHHQAPPLLKMLPPIGPAGSVAIVAMAQYYLLNRMVDRSRGIPVKAEQASRAEEQRRAEEEERRAEVKPPIKSELWNPEASITKAQPKLPTLKLLIGNPPTEVTAEMAISQQQIATGLMHRKSLGLNEGMLFIFAEPKKAAFYMRNTTVPLTVAYLGSSGVIMELHDLEPLNEKPVESQSELVRFVLEMPRDWFKKNGVTEAQKVRAVKGTLLEVFFLEE